MDKSVLEKFISNLEAAGIDRYMIRVEGGNRIIEHNTESSRIFLQDDYALAIETKNNYGSDSGVFNIKCTPYDNIDNATSFDITTQQILDFLSAEGIEIDEDLKKFISAHGARVGIKPGYGGHGEVLDKEGKPVLDNGMPRVTTGYSV